MSMPPVEVYQFPCLEDNYGYLVRDPVTGYTGCVDTPEVEAIERALEHTGWELTHILNTHHHFDHAGGNLEIKEKTGAVIVGPREEVERIPGMDVQLGNNDEYFFGKQTMTVMMTPGHTRGHCIFYFKDSNVVFVGDTLFALGCGRLFEGSPEEMLDSLQRLAAMPDETKVYCAHEYTQANAKFALTVEPQNSALAERAAEIDELRAANKPTVPTTIGLERRTNPFMRSDSADLRATLGMEDAADVEVFAETRSRKDSF